MTRADHVSVSPAQRRVLEPAGTGKGTKLSFVSCFLL